jgi:AcrR family transcriptional regulator
VAAHGANGSGRDVSGLRGAPARSARHKTGSTTRHRTQGQRAPRHAGQIPGGRHGLPREAVAESQRRRLLDAMTAVAAERGYHETGIAEVIAAAGVSRRTFYEQFAGKDECFAAAYGEQIDRLLAIAMSAFAGDGSWPTRLRAALTALCGALAADPVAARVCFVEALDAGPVTSERRREALRGLLPLFEDAPGDALEVLSFADSLAIGRLGDLSEVLRAEIAADATATLPRLVPELAYMLVLPFLGPERAIQELGGGRGLRPVS